MVTEVSVDLGEIENGRSLAASCFGVEGFVGYILHGFDALVLSPNAVVRVVALDVKQRHAQVLCIQQVDLKAQTYMRNVISA